MDVATETETGIAHGVERSAVGVEAGKQATERSRFCTSESSTLFCNCRSRRRRRRRSSSGSRDRDRRKKKKSRTPSPTPEEIKEREKQQELMELTRDVRTVFVSQLQVKCTEKDVKRFFEKVGKASRVYVGCIYVRSVWNVFPHVTWHIVRRGRSK